MIMTTEDKINVLMDADIMSNDCCYLMDNIDILENLEPTKIIEMTKHSAFDINDAYFRIDPTYNICISFKDDDELIEEMWNEDIEERLGE